MRSFLGYFLPLLLIISIFIGFLLSKEYKRFSGLIESNEQLHVSLIKKTLTDDLMAIGPDLKLLLYNEDLHNYLENPTEKNLKIVEKTFLLFSKHRRIYDQVRFIDITGQEKIRIDYDQTTGPHAVSALQNKTGRYYFDESISLSNKEVYLSPLDLNIENKKIEIPYKPMIRFATPVFDQSGQKRGVLVLNFLAQPLLDHVTEFSHDGWGFINFVNQNGYWFLSKEKEKNWGFMFEDGERFQDKMPSVWKYLSSKEKGTFSDKETIYSFSSLTPHTQVSESLTSNLDLKDLIKRDQFKWKIISIVPKTIIKNHTIKNFKTTTGPLWLSMVIVVMLGSWIFSVQKNKQRQLQIQAQMHAKVFSGTTQGITINDPEGIIIDVNSGFSRISGYSHEDVIGKNSNLLSSGQQDKQFYKSMWFELNNKNTWEGELVNRHKDGHYYYIMLHIAPVLNDKNQIVYFIGLFSDISEQKEQEKNLITQAHTDPLTGLANRSSLRLFLDRELARAKRYKTMLAIIYIDLNNFKPVNDTYGHAAGDQVLKEIANRLKNYARETDLVVRLGGDEFCLILPDIKSVEEVKETSHRMTKIIKKPILTEYGEFSMGFSCGYALYPSDGHDMDSLIKAADKKMYKQKAYKRFKVV